MLYSGSVAETVPNKTVYKESEVCEIAQVQPYILRSWETEFKPLGVVQGQNRFYRRSDLNRVLRIKHLLFVEGLTLAGARRRLEGENDQTRREPDEVASLEQLMAADVRERLAGVRRGLRSILDLLGGSSEITTPHDTPRRAASPVASASASASSMARAVPLARPDPSQRGGKKPASAQSRSARTERRGATVKGRRR